MICAKCERHVAFGYLTSEGQVCLNCKLKLEPPTMEFLKHGASGMLYNVDEDEYECYMELSDFENCGWFIRRKTIALNDKGQVIIRYYLEYHGRTICGRCKKTVFPSFYTACDDTTCCISRSKFAGAMAN